MHARILIVEDQNWQRLADEAAMRRITTTALDIHGISSLQCDSADSVETAFDLLNRAGNDGTPYDIMILDLGLPMTTSQRTPTPAENGFKVLEEAFRSKTARAIVVNSIFREYKFVADAFRNGAVDYVAKAQPDEFDLLQERVLVAWDAIVEREAEKIATERIKALIPHAELGLTYRLGLCFSEVVQAISRESRSMRLAIREHFDGKGTTDPLLVSLDLLERSSEATRAEWRHHEINLGLNIHARETIALRDLLQSVVCQINFMLTAKRASVMIPDVTSQVLSFGSDVALVLKEILLGSVVEMPTSRGVELCTITVSIHAEPDDGVMVVEFKDSLPAIDGDLAERINHGGVVQPTSRFGRAWGLSIIQHVAMRGGGKVEIQPAPQGKGNLVKCHLPVA